MNRRSVLFAACLYVVLGHSVAHGQRETERFIPIGQSPGASGKTTRIGTVEGVDPAARSFELATSEGRYKVQVPGGVPIWLDRSRRKQKALSGSFDDLRAGRRVEVKYEDAERATRAVWIKVEVAE
jgi:hypothetical protein